MSDQQIIELLKNGRYERPFRKLYEYFPAVKKLILSKGGKIEDAEDIFQDALIVLCKKISEQDFRLEAKLNTYLYSVCRYMWKDELKKREKLSFTNFDSGLNNIDESDLHEALENESRHKLAEKIISGLGERCRDLLKLFYFDSLSIKAIAAKMGYSSENTTKIQKFKCLKTAKDRLKTVLTSTKKMD